MTLPAGFAYTVNVRPLGANCYGFDNAVRFSGVYELRKDRLVIIRGTGPNEKGYEWELRKSGEFVLVAQPLIGKTGANYLGATLRRLADGQEPPPKQRNPAPRQTRTKPAGDPRILARVAGGFKFKSAAAEKASPQELRSARALEQIKATYPLKKEPVYRAPPQYCLLLVGGQDPAWLWMVSDGVTLYVDRNGNGDLTEPGEAIPFRAAGFAAYFADPFPGGGAQHRHLHIAVRQRDWKTNTGGYWSARIEVKGRYAMYAFAHKFAKKPEYAPVIHLGGPLRMGLEEVAGGRLLRGRKIELAAHVISQYPGTEKAFVDVDQHCPKDVHPIAEIVLPPRTPGGKFTTLNVPLTRRC